MSKRLKYILTLIGKKQSNLEYLSQTETQILSLYSNKHTLSVVIPTVTTVRV